LNVFKTKFENQIKNVKIKLNAIKPVQGENVSEFEWNKKTRGMRHLDGGFLQLCDSL